MRYAFPLVLVLSACPPPPAPPPPPTPWQPGQVLRQSRTANARGFLELRGLVHAHSIYSHDACDGMPHDANGVYDLNCLEDFRRGACQAGHDFFFLTDHGDSFSGNEFPQVLLHDASRGDVLVERNGGPVANWLSCPSGAAPLVMAGTETGTMPVGLEHHVADAGVRNDIYLQIDNRALDAYHQAGAVTLVPHLEDWTVQQLIDLHLDGFEMFNLHRNALKNAGIALDLILTYVEPGRAAELQHPDLFLAGFVLDDDTYLSTWGTVVARGNHRVTTMGSDCHRNTFPQLLADGERIDSYRRMMSAFSNHLLVKPKADGSWDDMDLKAALKAGRNFGVFEFLGYAEGFDVSLREGDVVRELGDVATLARGVTLEATLPTVRGLDPAAEAPALRLVAYRAREGGWDVVGETTDAKLSVPLTRAGAYRVEVRMVPKHLKAYAGIKRSYFTAERPWVMSSALYVE